ncbi:MAG TPA: 2-phospho-L-lactate guanylyltransferase [Intrasporangium sp.]|uniref:2-phospho-L-lactate guanylyltransferase n=1 Tax=Intrasporangium sp. TaxID=1925024 RepID=UPI002D78079B|nr:2-phospho-L-lactate guanylyltransferase [Intrasporangium sp.]HET7399235.1 2-phospho-L-lactate guanylyltransferase [Intrasporangium sp.]
MSASSSPSRPWWVVVPVKDARVGKSRLAAAAGPDRERLTRAIADDTVRAAASVVGAQRLVLVTADRPLATSWAAAGAIVVDDPGRGLNEAISAALGSLALPGPYAALLGDLPALRPADLAAALVAAEQHEQSFVPDADGTGTVLRCGRSFVPRFGVGSAAAHAADGAARLDLDLPRLRTDVDDEQSLAAAVRLGLGPATRSALDAVVGGVLEAPVTEPVATTATRFRHMQATVHRYDEGTGTGSVLRDDGSELPFDAEALAGSGLRLLRPGQRVTIDVSADRVTALHIVGIGEGQQIR